MTEINDLDKLIDSLTNKIYGDEKKIKIKETLVFDFMLSLSLTMFHIIDNIVTSISEEKVDDNLVNKKYPELKKVVENFPDTITDKWLEKIEKQINEEEKAFRNQAEYGTENPLMESMMSDFYKKMIEENRKTAKDVAEVFRKLLKMGRKKE